MLVYKPQLLIVTGFGPLLTMYSILTATVGIFMLAVASEGYFLGKLGAWQRLLLLAGVFGLLLLNWRGDIIAVPIIAMVVAYQIIKRKKTMAAAS
jgi:TRAP-type uncharacterized transport system fused permease subunit